MVGHGELRPSGGRQPCSTMCGAAPAQLSGDGGPAADAGGPSRLLLKSYNDPHLDKFVQAAVVPEGPHAASGKA